MRRVSVVTATAAVFMLAGTANAHPKLVSASPAANATVAKPARVQLRFSEKLMPAFSKADLTMESKGMAAMEHLSTSALEADGRTLVITPQGQLHPGRYTVNWHVVSTDTHKVEGSYAFAVK